MQLSEHMGDARHKRPPPDTAEREVTEEWRLRIRHRLEQNKLENRSNGLNSRSPGRKPDNHETLAAAVGTDKTMIANIIGQVRSYDPSSCVARSGFVDAISRVLGEALPTIYADEFQLRIAGLNALERQAIRAALDHPDRARILAELLDLATRSKR